MELCFPVDVDAYVLDKLQVRLPFLDGLTKLGHNRLAGARVWAYPKPVPLQKKLDIEREKSMLHSGLGPVGVACEVVNVVFA